ncbi:hypothetical protein [Variovorax sp. YR566]|uniref:hypothetical protein n=1 Tax=Variovorax sp. YR566 TaxID=3450237 RepID=UPI003F7D629D
MASENLNDSLQLKLTGDQYDHLVELLKEKNLWDEIKGQVIDTLDQSTPPVGEFKEIYDYISSVIEGSSSVNRDTKFWFSAAGFINGNIRSVASVNYIRDSTQYGLEFRGKLAGYTQAQIDAGIQQTSNYIGQNVISQILKDHGIPVFPKMLSFDIGAAILTPMPDPNFGQDAGGWGGTFYFWNEQLNYGNSLNRPRVDVGDAVVNGLASEDIPVVNGVQMPAQLPSLQEFMYANTQAASDAAITNLKNAVTGAQVLVPGYSLFDYLFNSGSAFETGMKAAKDTWQAISAGYNAETPKAVKNALMLNTALEVAGRLLTGHLQTGPQASAGSSSSDATSTLSGDLLKVAYANGDEIDETLAMDGGTPSEHWADANGASGDISVAFDANGAATESDTWENRFGIGSTGTDTYNSDGSSTGTINYAGGGYATYMEDSQGNVTTDYYTSSGNLYAAGWVHADGSSGTETIFSNGQTDTPHGSGSNFSVPQSDYITLINPDGSYWTRSNDVQDTLHTTVVDAQGVASAQTDTTGDGVDYDRASNTSSVVTLNGGSITNFRDGQGHLTHDSWTATDGTSGTDTYYASGAISGKTTHTDGSSDTYALYQTPGGAASTFNASSLVNISVLGELDLTRDHFNADGTLASDTWTSSDGASGQDSFDTDGSGTGSVTHADGSASTVTLDASGGITIDNRSGDGSLTSQDWWQADGTRGIKTYNADGVLSTSYDYQLNGKVLVTQWAADGTAEEQQTEFAGSLFSLDGSGFGKIVNSDGSYSVNYNDANGDALIFKYGTAGQLQGTDHVSASRETTSEFNGTFADGSAWSSPYNPMTPVVTQADGTQYTYYTDTNGRVTGDDWVKLDGSQGSDTFYADGSSRSETFNVDGTSITIADDGKENITNVFFGADGAETGDAWQEANGSHGSDTYGADGSSSGSTYNVDGSAIAYTDDGQGNDEQTTYATSGVITADLRDYADGSRVYTAVNTDGSGTRTYDAEGDGQEIVAVELFNTAGLTTLTTTTTTFDDGSSQVVSDDGKGNIERRAFDPTGSLLSDTWTHPDGSRGVANFGTGGTSASTSVAADGHVTTVVTQSGAQASITSVYDASGTLISETWTHADDTHGSTTYSDTGKSTTTYQADGTHMVEDLVYGATYTNSYYSAADILTSKESWPAQGDAITRTTYNTDGSYSVAVGFSDDAAHPDVTTSDYSASGTLLRTTLAHPDGSSEGASYNGDGSYSSFTRNAQGDVSQTTYSAAGIRTSGSTQNAGGLASSQTTIDSAGNATTVHFDGAGHALWQSWLNADGSSGRSNLGTSANTAYDDFLKSGQYSVANAAPLNQQAGHSVKGDMYNPYGSTVTSTQLNFEVLDAAGNPVLMMTGNRSPDTDEGSVQNFDAVSAFLAGGTVADFGAGLSRASLSSGGKVLLDADGTLHYVQTAQEGGQGALDDSVENFQPVLGVTRDAANQAFEAIVANQTVTPRPSSPPVYAASTADSSPIVSIKYLSPDEAAALGSQQVPAGSSVQIRAASVPAGQPLPAYLVGHAVLDASSQTYEYFEVITTVTALSAVQPVPESSEVYTTGTIDESFQTADGVQTEHYQYTLGSYGDNQSPYLVSESFVGNDGSTASFDVQGDGEDTDNLRAHFADGTDAYTGHVDGQTLQNQADGASAWIGDMRQAITDATGMVQLGQTNGATIDENLPGIEIGTTGVNNSYGSPRSVVVNVDTVDRHMALSFDANGQLTSDKWSDKDGTIGKITYASDGSSQGIIEYADGNYSQTSNDAQNNYRVKNYEVDGTLTSEAWGTMGGSSGTDFYDAQGASHGEVDNVDGSYSRYVDDGLGNTTTQTYSATDVLLSDSWVHADGTHGGTVYATATPGSATTHDSDGSYRIATIDADGGVTVKSYSSTGALTHEKWFAADGTHGDNSYASDGSGTGVTYGVDSSLGRSTYYADGSSNTTTVQADQSYTFNTTETNGDTNTQSYSAYGQLTASHWTKIDGSHGDDSFDSDGTVISSTSYAADGSHTSTATDSDGKTTTLVYSSSDVLTGRSWTSSDGSRGTETFNADGSSSDTWADANGSSGTDQYDVNGSLISDTWRSPDGTYGADTSALDGSSTSTIFNTDGSILTTAYSADGSYAITTTDPVGNVKAEEFSAAGILVDDSWTHTDGSHGSDTFNADGTPASQTVYLGSDAASIDWGDWNGVVTATDGLGVVDTIRLGNGDNQITLGQGNDVVTVGSGQNTLVLGDGNNSVTMGAGHNQLMLGNGSNAIQLDGGSDTLALASGQYHISGTVGQLDIELLAGVHDKLWFQEQGNNLEISVLGSSESITIDNWSAGNQLSSLKASDGLTISAGDISSLVQAMASFAPPAAGQLVYTAQEQQALAPTLAASWH